MKKMSWYPFENNKYVIEIKTEKLEQLFDKRDPNPFRIKDLDDDAVEYIVTCANEIGLQKLGKLRIIIAENSSAELVETIQTAISEYFHYRSEMTLKKIRSTLSLGFKTLLIGISFLAFSIIISALIGNYVEDHFIRTFVKEGLVLLGWVSMWKPLNIFLYEWWPLVEIRKYYLCLSEIETEVRTN